MMASDVLKDLVRALCSLDIVEPPVKRAAAGTPSPQAARCAIPSERSDASAQEAA